ncbi:MAG: 4-diphosphocytidyl-2-C-methyl-D-erythritol kinase [Candidatus Kapaibacterium sp.]|nr:MAG: 4-diphosphocytidyl-2-C-methyl-D-erythritol kinase [Candidatus Kapabacteria bacterium]
MIERCAFAKINIGLHVLGKRDDGYHSIATIFAPLAFHDRITIEPAHELHIQMVPSYGITERENLVWRAATLLAKRLGCTSGAKITIEKHIPPGSGLGGGSSNAASVLLGLLSLWNRTLPYDELRALALELGSDVPFFLRPQLAYAEGRGEQLTPLPPIPERSVLLVLPNFFISTSWAYSALARSGEHPRPRLLSDALIVSALDGALLRSVCTNDFESVVFAAHPELAAIKEQLYNVGAQYASLSGTGSALFGFFENRSAALHAAAQMRNYRTVVTTIVTGANDNTGSCS